MRNSLGSNNLRNMRDMILSYDSINRRSHHISTNHDYLRFNPRSFRRKIFEFFTDYLVIRNCTYNIGRKKIHQPFAPCSLAHFKNQLFSSYSHSIQQAKRITGDELGFNVQHKINRVFEYSNNDDENFWQLSLYLTHHGENKVTPPSVGAKTLQFQYDLKLEHSQMSKVLDDQVSQVFSASKARDGEYFNSFLFWYHLLVTVIKVRPSVFFQKTIFSKKMKLWLFHLHQ